MEVEDFSCSLLAGESILSRAASSSASEEPESRVCVSSGFHLDFDLFTARRQRGVAAVGLPVGGGGVEERLLDSLPAGASTQSLRHQCEFGKKKVLKLRDYQLMIVFASFY